MIWKKLQILLLFMGVWTLSNAQTMADFPWIQSELTTDNCCNNQSVTVFPQGGYAFVYIKVDDECGTTKSKLYFEDGRCWCTDNTGLDCLGAYNLDASTGVNVYSCTGETPAYNVFSEYNWLSNVVDQNDCCGNSNIQIIDLGSYSFVYVSSDPGCPNDFGQLYFETGQLYCSDASNYDCLLAYGFPNASFSSAWSCDGEINVDTEMETDTDTNTGTDMDTDADTNTGTDTEETDTTEPVSGLHAAFAEFDEGSFQIYLEGNEVVIETDGLPNHTSPYWSSTVERAIAGDGNDAGGPPTGGPGGGGPGGGGPPGGGPGGDAGGDNAGGGGTTVAEVNHPLWVEPTVTSYDQMAPGNIDDFMGSYTLRVSTDPQRANSSTSTGLGAIGIAVSGAVIYNDEEGPNVPLDNAVGSLDYTAAHTGPQSYHYHLEPKAWSDDDDKLIGIISDGFFLYGRKCASTGTYPTDLDESGGHTSTTQHTDEGEYHYHIQNELYLNAYYILFPGDYQGTPNDIR